MRDHDDTSGRAASAIGRSAPTVSCADLEDALWNPVLDLKVAAALAEELYVDGVEKVVLGDRVDWRLTDEQHERFSFMSRLARDLAADLVRRVEELMAEQAPGSPTEGR